MLNIPVKNPLAVQLITVSAGLVAVLVAHFVPDYSVLLSQVLQVLGIGGIGVGLAQITSSAPSSSGGNSGTGDPEPTRVPTNGFDGEPLRFRSHSLLGLCATLAVYLAMAACLLLGAVSCSGAPAKPPCDEATLAKLTAVCSAFAFTCGQQGKSEDECTAECDRKLDARAEACR